MSTHWRGSGTTSTEWPYVRETEEREGAYWAGHGVRIQLPLGRGRARHLRRPSGEASGVRQLCAWHLGAIVACLEKFYKEMARTQSRGGAHGQSPAGRTGVLHPSPPHRQGARDHPRALLLSGHAVPKAPSRQTGAGGLGTGTKLVSQEGWPQSPRPCPGPARLTLLRGVSTAQGLSWKRRGLQLGIRRRWAGRRHGRCTQAVQCGGRWGENLRPRLQNGRLQRWRRTLARGCGQGARGPLAGGSHAGTCGKKTSHPTRHFHLTRH